MASPIAAAFVRISPSFTDFKAKLLAELKVQMAGVAGSVPITPVPVGAAITPVVTGAAAASAAAAKAVSGGTAAAAAGSAAAKTGREITALTKEQTIALEGLERARIAAGSAAVKLLTFEGLESVGVKNLTTLRSKLREADRLVTTQEAAVAEASRTTDVALQKLTATNLELSQAQQTEIKTALEQAVANEESAAAATKAAAAQKQVAAAAEKSSIAQANALGQVRKGAFATSLSLLGARGATLAAGNQFLIGAAAAALFAKSIAAFSNFQRTLNVLQATSGATADQMKIVSATARQLGQDITLPAVSAADAATTITELSKAGLSLDQSLAGARGVLQLATAAQIDFAAATNIAASALNAFKLSGEEAGHVADVLANAADAAQGSIQDMGLGLANVASVAHQAGISLEDTSALLTLLAKNGIQGAEGGTVLRVALLRLIAPSKEAAAIIADLGIQIRDANGNIRADVFTQFGEALRGLSPAARDAAEAIVFGSRGIRAVATISNEGRINLEAMQEEMGKVGTASELAGAQTKGLSGDFEKLKNAGSGIAIDFGKLVSPAVHDATIAIGLFGKAIDSVVGSTGFLNQALRFFGPGGPLIGIRVAFDEVKKASEFLTGDAIENSIPVVRKFSEEMVSSLDSVTESLTRLTDTFNILGATAVNALGGLSAQLQQSAGILKLPELGKQLMTALKLSLSDDPTLAEGAKKSLDVLIAKIASLGPKGKEKLRAAGKEFMSFLAEGITQNQKDALAAANQAVSDAIAQGQKQVHDAVVSAKSNLGSITQGLASAVGQVLDARAEAAISALDKSPLAREIKFLTAELDKTNIAQQRSDIQFQIASATDDASRRSAIAQLTQFDLQANLDTKKKKLDAEKENIKKTAEAQKEAITRNLAAYADQFARGQRTLASFSSIVLKTLNTQEGPFSKVGNLLGSAFKASFTDQINAVLEQAKALAKFVGVAAGGTTQVGVVKPGETLAASQKSIADAQAARDKTRDGFLKDGNVILADINKAIRTLPAAGPGQATTAQRARNSQKVK